MLVILIILFAILLQREDPTLSVTVYRSTSGTLDVDEFLKTLSQGPVKVIMGPALAEELRRKHIKITAPALSDVPLKPVLEKTLLSQLPGPQQWTYEVEGQTVRIKRR